MYRDSVDWKESVDKRKLHDLDAFGYNSLHYICRLKTGGPRFELQMRTALQHVWSTIEHDAGYKGDVKIPREYMRQFDRLNRRIAAVNQAEIYPVSMLSYLAVLESFGLETLGDVQHLIDDNSDDAFQLAVSQLAITDIDLLSSNTALQYLCLVYVLKHGGGRDGLKSLYDLINGESDTNGMLADLMMEQANTLPFMEENNNM